MSPRRRVVRSRFAVLAAALFAGVGSAAARPPDFVGIITVGETNLFALQSTPETPVAWCRVGERLGPYSVIGYDRAAARVTLRADGERVVVSLRTAQVPASPPAAVDTPEGQRLVRAAFQALFDTGEAPVALREATTLAAGSDAGTRFLDATGSPPADDLVRPVHIVVPADTALEEVARRVRQPVARLAALNPAFEPIRDSTARHTVRVR